MKFHVKPNIKRIKVPKSDYRYCAINDKMEILLAPSIIFSKSDSLVLCDLKSGECRKIESYKGTIDYVKSYGDTFTFNIGRMDFALSNGKLIGPFFPLGRFACDGKEAIISIVGRTDVLPLDGRMGYAFEYKTSFPPLAKGVRTYIFKTTKDEWATVHYGSIDEEKIRFEVTYPERKRVIRLDFPIRYIDIYSWSISMGNGFLTAVFSRGVDYDIVFFHLDGKMNMIKLEKMRIERMVPIGPIGSGFAFHAERVLKKKEYIAFVTPNGFTEVLEYDRIPGGLMCARTLKDRVVAVYGVKEKSDAVQELIVAEFRKIPILKFPLVHS